jgi:hypothetical protein
MRYLIVLMFVFVAGCEGNCLVACVEHGGKFDDCKQSCHQIWNGGLK